MLKSRKHCQEFNEMINFCEIIFFLFYLEFILYAQSFKIILWTEKKNNTKTKKKHLNYRTKFFTLKNTYNSF